MTQAAVQPTPEAPAAETVTIELGPDTKLYPESLIPAEPPKAPEPPAPESSEPGESEPPPSDAGPSEEKGSRRQRGEDAYQRGLREGREAAARDREVAEQTRIQQEAIQTERNRIRQAYRDLKSNDYDAREQAGKFLGDLADTSEQAVIHQMAGRNQLLAELAQGFVAARDSIEGLDDDTKQQLWSSPNPGELAKKAYEFGQKAAKTAADERIAELEGQLEAARGKRVGTSLTPDTKNGSSGSGGRLTLEEYQRMSPREARKLPSSVIDQLTAEMAAEVQRNGR